MEWLVLIIILGLALGSFINASAWRIHEQEEKNNKKLSIMTGRSQCESCGHQLSSLDLVPVFSWMTLGGKCRYCGKEISWINPAVEVLTGVLFAVSYLTWEFNGSGEVAEFGLWLVFLSGLIGLAIYDLRWLILPNRIIYPMIIGVLAYVPLKAVFFSGGADLIRESVIGVAVGGGLFYVLFTVSRGRWIGGGDVKLGVFIGAYLGVQNTILALILAFNSAAVLILPLLLIGLVKRKTPIPFGPFLIAATIVSALYGSQIVDWYSDAFLYGLI